MKFSRLAWFALAASVCFPNPTIVIAQQKPPETAPAKPKTDVNAPQQKAQANPDAVILVDFKERLDKYLELRTQAKKGLPPMKETKEPAEIKAAQHALAARIQELRATAQPGDIFTPQIRDKFRRLLNPELKGEDGQDARAVVKDDAPPVASISFKPNAPYPEGKPFPTVPANLLLNIPTLPDELEYRIIDKHLILRDTDANIIVDYVPNAIR